jgi:hypothetical protein
LLCQIADLVQAFLPFKPIDQIDGIEEVHTLGLMNRCDANGRRQMRFAGTCAADQAGN